MIHVYFTNFHLMKNTVIGKSTIYRYLNLFDIKMNTLVPVSSLIITKSITDLQLCIMQAD